MSVVTSLTLEERNAELEAQLLEASELLEKPIGHGVGILCVAEAVRVVLAQLATEQAEHTREVLLHEVLLHAVTQIQRWAYEERGTKAKLTEQIAERGHKPDCARQDALQPAAEEKSTNEPTYIGDGVYVIGEEDRIVIFTSSGIETTNEIVLEPDTERSLFDLLKRRANEKA